MVVTNGHAVAPKQRQNRRRERPGSRSRRILSRKANLQYELHEGLLDAHDASIQLPSDKTSPSPLLRQSFDQSWQRWQAWETEEKALAEMDKRWLEQEQLVMFGGELGDDELRRLGILYNTNDDLAPEDESNTVACGVPVESPPPMFILRHGKPRRSQRPSTLRPILLHLPLSFLTDDDVNIPRLLSLPASPSPCPPTIQHRADTLPPLDPPLQSLPPPHLIRNDTTIPIPPSSVSVPDSDLGDWTFITTSHPHPHSSRSRSSPPSEPETWILIDDS
ncbi:hypothetical protein LZ554_006810 [Drepanopeziza brunnea f. sp. 'monogermtubi']|nr:hypothetical protein LZ554_006810 [Drepanopeziza brunnea f. sp. 'monogermtubi']